MLDHDDGGLAELGDALVGRLGVVDVVVAELLALHLARGGDARPLAAVGIERRLLVRVLAVAQHLHALGRERQPLGEGLALLLGEPGGDRRIVGRGAGIGLGRELAAQRQRRRALVARQSRRAPLVVAGIDHDRHEVMVLGRGADQRRPADVDVLDGGREVGAARHRRLERVEVHHDQVDRRDLVVGHRLGVAGVGAAGEDAAMDRGLQRLHPAVHDLGEAGVVADLDHLRRRPRAASWPSRRSTGSPPRAPPAPGRARPARSCRTRKSAPARSSRGRASARGRIGGRRTWRSSRPPRAV